MSHADTDPLQLAPVQLAMGSKTFCVYPWIEQVVQANGKISYCCMAESGGQLFNDAGIAYTVAENQILDIWNSDDLRGIRRQMAVGEKVARCKSCHYQESIGKRSPRQMVNDEWLEKMGPEIQARVAASLSNEFRVTLPPAYLDLRLGNLCNLKCRSCNPYNSSRIHQEVLELIDDVPDFAGLWKRHYPGRPRAVGSEWTEDPDFWLEITAAIPHLRKVYLTGGEPTLIEKNYEFMQTCIESGHAKHIFLMFNINATHVTDRFLEYLPQFELALVNLSIDAVGPLNEYLRFGSKWSKVDENVRKLARLRGPVQLGITPVFQAFNALEITKVLDYAETISQLAERPLNVDFLHAHSPSFIDPRVLPPSIRAEAIGRLESFRAHSPYHDQGGFVRASVDGAIHILAQDDGHSPHKVAELLRYTQILDRHRQQDFRVALPELWRLLADEGHSYVV